jgi:hypothetical protein
MAAPPQAHSPPVRMFWTFSPSWPYPPACPNCALLLSPASPTKATGTPSHLNPRSSQRDLAEMTAKAHMSALLTSPHGCLRTDPGPGTAVPGIPTCSPPSSSALSQPHQAISLPQGLCTPLLASQSSLLPTWHRVPPPHPPGLILGATFSERLPYSPLAPMWSLSPKDRASSLLSTAQEPNLAPANTAGHTS